jgi:hypothetical protein
MAIASCVAVGHDVTVAMRTVMKLLAFSVPAVVVTLALLEFVVLRWFVPVDSVPLEEYDLSSQVVHYRPHQTGITYPDRDIRHPVPFAINDDGWNSFHPRYDVARGRKLRVAVVGDSYVAAFEVAQRLSLAADLEALLGAEDCEVYAFGVRGAPLSEYLLLARHAVAKYKPDVVVIVIVHNDFDESYRIVPGRYTASFLHVAVDGTEVKEIAPQPYDEPALEAWLRSRSFLFRFFFYRLRVGSQQLRSLYASYLGAAHHYEANVETSQLASEEPRMRMAAEYLFGQFAALAHSSGTGVVAIMDSPRDAIYSGHDPRAADAYRLNRIAAEASAQAGIPFVDMTSSFERDWATHHERFEFASDGHWNARAHRLAAHAVCELVATGFPERNMRCGESPA